MKTVSALFCAFAPLATLVSAIPIEKRDVFVPPILYPHAGTVWQVGNHHNVTWSLENEPVNITNYLGMIVLAENNRIFATGPGSLASPLASNFSIKLGRTVIQVPDVPPAADYQLVLFGDSGNFSPEFTITS